MMSLPLFSFFFESYADHRDLHSFPTRRSSDLDVRDEFVSVTEKLMDELAQCYNVLPQLDINNTIDHRPEGDEKWFLVLLISSWGKIGRAVQQECRDRSRMPSSA